MNALDELKADNAKLLAERESLKRDIATARAWNVTLLDAEKATSAKRVAAERERDAALAERDTARQEADELRKQMAALRLEFEPLRKEVGHLRNLVVKYSNHAQHVVGIVDACVALRSAFDDQGGLK